MIDIKFKRKDGTIDHWYEKDGIVYWKLGKEDIILNMGLVEEWKEIIPTTPIMFKR